MLQTFLVFQFIYHSPFLVSHTAAYSADFTEEHVRFFLIMYFWAFASSVGITVVMLIALYAFFGWQTARLAMTDNSPVRTRRPPLSLSDPAIEPVRGPEVSKRAFSSPPRKSQKLSTMIDILNCFLAKLSTQRKSQDPLLMKNRHRYPLTNLSLLLNDAYDIQTINVRWNASGSKLAGKGFCNFLIHGHYYLHIVLKNYCTRQLLPITIHRLLLGDAFYYNVAWHHVIQDQHLYGVKFDTPVSATRLLNEITKASSKPFNYLFNNCFTFANTIFKSTLHSVKQNRVG